MSGQTETYQGYVNTDFIRAKAGFKSEVRITDNEINSCIKTAEETANDTTNLSWYPYPKDANEVSLGNPANVPPYTIKEATKFLAIGLLRNIYPDENDTYQKNWDMGMTLLKGFVNTNQAGATAVSGDSVLSDYNADTNNPDVAPDLTTKNFSRDYIPTYRRNS